MIYWVVFLLMLIVASAAVIITLVNYPDWITTPAGLIKLIVAAITGTLSTAVGVTSLLKNLKDLKMRGKTWDEPPLRKITLEQIKATLGRGGTVNYIDRHSSDKNLLFHHSKIVITGPMKTGKTREAIEIMERAIRDDLITNDQIYEPTQTLRVLDPSELQKALKQELDTGKCLLIFIDDLPRELLPDALEKWNTLFQACEHCPFFYVISTARSDQLTDEHKNWMKKQDFFEVELKPLPREDVDKLTLAASGVFGLQLSEDARLVFVKDSDGRPETTLIGMRRLATDSGPREVSVETAKTVSKDSLETSWLEVTGHLAKHLKGAQYWLDSLAIFHIINIRESMEMVRALAYYLWWKDNKWIVPWRRKYYLGTAFLKMVDYGFLEQDGLIRYPEVAVEGRCFLDNAKETLLTFLSRYRFKYSGVIINPHVSNAPLARALFELAGITKDKQEAINLYSYALDKLPYYIIFINRGNMYSALGQHERAISDYDKAIIINPDDADAYIDRGLDFSALGQHERAIEDYNKAITINSEDAEIYYNRGFEYAALGQRERAIKEYDNAININKVYLAAYINRGNINATLGQYKRAIEDYDKAITINPEYKLAYYNKSCCYAMQGKPGEAVSFLKQALEKDRDQFLEMAAEDHDFDGIRNTDEFQKLMAEFCQKPQPPLP